LLLVTAVFINLQTLTRSRLWLLLAAGDLVPQSCESATAAAEAAAAGRLILFSKRAG
jgi:hypothetical protein